MEYLVLYFFAIKRHDEENTQDLGHRVMYKSTDEGIMYVEINELADMLPLIKLPSGMQVKFTHMTHVLLYIPSLELR